MENETPEVIEVEPTPVKKKKKTYRRRAKVKRAWLIVMGKKRIEADDAGVSSGLLYYVIDGVHTYVPVARKVQIIPGVPPVPIISPEPRNWAEPAPGYDPPQNFFTRSREEDLARADQMFATERASELESLMRPAFRLAPIEEEEA